MYTRVSFLLRGLVFTFCSIDSVLGVMKGDEIVIVNNWIVQDLDLDTLDRYLNKPPVMLTLRSSR
jgi:hypothetical protein